MKGRKIEKDRDRENEKMEFEREMVLSGREIL